MKPSHFHWTGFPTLSIDGADKIGLPSLNNATVAGISAAIAGNVLISLALNCQKLAHLRLEREREAKRVQELEQRVSKDRQSDGTLQEEDEDGSPSPMGAPSSSYSSQQASRENISMLPTGSGVAVVETEPLLGTSHRPSAVSYDTLPGSIRNTHTERKRSMFSRFWPSRTVDAARRADLAHVGATHAMIPVDVVAVHTAPNSNGHSLDDHAKDEPTTQNGNESDYLKSKLWWLGFILMNVGEIGNFISYAFAPASVVAPLGTFALIANCLFAPLMLGERFRKRDLLGVLIAILGTITVVLSTNPSDVRLDPAGLIHAISQHVFILYSIVYIIGAIILTGLSEGSVGQRYVYVDVGLCALFGGFTVLSTKAISTLLTMEWFEIFTEWITYPVIAILLGTGIGQIRYLNRALMRFDSKIVVPTQFVLFNLSAITGSAILYGDFRRATFHQIVTFLYGCGATFAGVFIITWTARSASTEEDDEEDEHVGESDGDGRRSRNLRIESISRRNRATLLVPDGTTSTTGTPILRNKQSVVSMIGFSPAQRVLLVHTPPRDEFIRPLFQDIEALPRTAMHTPDSFSRRRAISWFGDDVGPVRNSLRRTRTGSNVGTRDDSWNREHSDARSNDPF